MLIEMAKQLPTTIKQKQSLLKNLFFIILQKTNLKHKLL